MLKKYSVTPDEKNYNINFSKKKCNGFDMHIHDYYELELILSGNGTTTINGKKYELEKGSIFLITPSDVHNYECASELHLACLSFTPDIIEYSIFLEMLYPMQYIVGKADAELLGTLVGYCEQISKIAEGSHKFAEKYISHLITCILIELYNMDCIKTIETQKQTSSYSPVQKAIWYINAHFKEDITLDTVANYVGIPPSSLGKKFSKYYNINYKEYLMNLRLQYAKSLITYTNESLTDIAYYSGFNSLSYFQKAFTNKYGISPKFIRK